MKHLISILAMSLVTVTATAQEVEFNIASWDLASDILRGEDNNFFYVYMDQNTGNRAIAWRKLVGNVMMLASIYVKDTRDNCFILSVSRLNGQTTLKANSSGCEQFDRISSWFVQAVTSPPDSGALERMN